MPDQYLLREQITSAGMGVVWRADQRALVREVQVRFVHPELAAIPELLTRLCHTAHVGSAIAAIDFGAEGAPPLLVMEHVDGAPVSQLLRGGERFSVGRAVALVAQVLRALHEAHAAGIVHADLRPEHVIVETRPDGSERVTLVDVGDRDDAARSGASAYLAPEVITGGRPTIASDLYAVGVILYELLTGVTPFSGEPCDVGYQLHGAAPPPSLRRPDRTIPAAVERATLRALACAPDARFSDTTAFAAALDTASVRRG